MSMEWSAADEFAYRMRAIEKAEERRKNKKEAEQTEYAKLLSQGYSYVVEYKREHPDEYAKMYKEHFGKKIF